MEYLAYDRIMRQYLFVWISVGLIILTVSVFCLIYLIKNKEPHYTFVIGLILTLGVMFGTIILVGDSVSNGIYDLRNQSYIIIDGKFDVIVDKKTPSRACSIILSDGTRLDTTTYVMKNGQYSGCVVYAEKTKKVLYVEVSD